MTRLSFLKTPFLRSRLLVVIAALAILQIDSNAESYVLSDKSQVAVGRSADSILLDQADTSATPAPVPPAGDRIYLMNLRHLSSDVCSVRFPTIPRVSRIDHCGRCSHSSLDQYRSEIHPSRPTVIYVHGNRYDSGDAIEAGMYVYRNTVKRVQPDVDWVIWSWPSERQGILGRDVRIKAERTDGQGLLLADFLRWHVEHDIPTTLIGFSFGGRVITGSMHALAGGALGGMRLPQPHLVGARFDVGLIAAAIERNWLNVGGYHGLATKNIHEITILYNRRDAVLKRYWLIDRVRGQAALGFSGPTSFAPRFDGSPLPVRSKDCSAIVGLDHDERDYYGTSCLGGVEMAKLVEDSLVGR